MSVILDRSADAPAGGFSKVQHAYAVLRGEILDGVYRPGEWLRMSRIAARLALSEMPVREALRLLEKDGLVRIHLHRGAQVASLAFARALEITEARMTLEHAAALAALGHHDATSLRAVEAALEAMRKAAGDLVQFALGNRAFAKTVYEPCPNLFLREHIQVLWDQVWQYSSTAVFEVMRHRVEDSLAENAAILAALAARDEAALIEVYSLRLQRSLDAWRQAIAERRVTREADGKE